MNGANALYSVKQLIFICSERADAKHRLASVQFPCRHLDRLSYNID